MKVTVYDADEIEWKEVTRLLEPYGFAPGKKNYIVSFSDGSGPSYVFYFSGRDILINLAYLDNATGGKSRFTDIVQIFRRTSSTVKTWDGDFRVPAAKKPSGR